MPPKAQKGIVTAMLKEMKKLSISTAKPKRKIEKQKYERKGQTKDRPPSNDPLRKFYTSLLKQKPDSKMALKWCLERGLIKECKINEVIRRLK